MMYCENGSWGCARFHEMLRIITVLLFVIFIGNSLSNPINFEEFSNVQEYNNDEDQSEYFEGDIILDAFQSAVIESKLRVGLTNPKYRWPNNVVLYEFDPKLEKSYREAVQDAFQRIESETCIKFVPKNKDTKGYIFISGSNSGCRSVVGYHGNKQKLNLHLNKVGHGCWRPGTIIHELLHALGLYHEQSSYDRDDYVQIFSKNIKEGHEHNFKKYTQRDADHFGVPYDYNSIMHYTKTEFSKNGKPTIVPKDKNAVIGQRKGLSKGDVKKINLMYNCKK